MTMDWMSSLIEATDPRGYVMAIRAIQQLDHLDRLPNVKTPTLVVAGRADAAVPPTVAALVAESMPNAQLRLLEETGHIGSVQQPVVFTETVGRFLLSTLGVEGTQSANEMETLK